MVDHDAKRVALLSSRSFADAVVSSEVINLHTVLLQNRPGWIGAPFVQKGHFFVIVEHGSLTATVNGQDVVLPAGSVCWIRDGVYRQLRVSSGVSVPNWRVRFGLYNDDQNAEMEAPWIVRGNSGSLIQHIQLLNDVQNNPSYEKEVAPLLSAFIHRVLSLPELSDCNQRLLSGGQRQRVERLVKRNLLLGVTPGDMAEEAGLSADYFSRLFKGTYGVPPRRYLLEKRMELAGDLLQETTLSVKEVCAELDESDVGTFCRLFKRITGKTPTQFRQGR